MKIVWEKFRKTIDDNSLAGPGDRVLVAVSGGPDSMCLLHLFARLRKMDGNIALHAAYIDHGLRPSEIKNEIKLIKSACEKLAVPFFVKKIDVSGERKKAGLESACRKLRYAALLGIAERYRCNRIATGHNINDQAETMILNLLRSAGEEGLTGIPVKRELSRRVSVIRPILKVSRKEITGYLKKNGVKFCTDSSNLSLSFTRNRVRHTVMPLLEKLNPGIYAHLDTMAGWNSVKEEYFDNLAEKALKQADGGLNSKRGISLDLNTLLKYNKYLQHKLIKSILLGNAGRKAYSGLAGDIIKFIGSGREGFTAGPFRITKKKSELNIKLIG